MLVWTIGTLQLSTSGIAIYWMIRYWILRRCQYWIFNIEILKASYWYWYWIFCRYWEKRILYHCLKRDVLTHTHKTNGDKKFLKCERASTQLTQALKFNKINKKQLHCKKTKQISLYISKFNIEFGLWYLKIVIILRYWAFRYWYWYWYWNFILFDIDIEWKTLILSSIYWYCIEIPGPPFRWRFTLVQFE